MKNRVVLLKGKYWSGLYIEGILVNQYNHIDEKEIYNYLEDKETYSTWYVNEIWLAHMGYLPEKLENTWLRDEKWK